MRVMRRLFTHPAGTYSVFWGRCIDGQLNFFNVAIALCCVSTVTITTLGLCGVLH